MWFSFAVIAAFLSLVRADFEAYSFAWAGSTAVYPIDSKSTASPPFNLATQTLAVSGLSSRIRLNSSLVVLSCSALDTNVDAATNSIRQSLELLYSLDVRQFLLVLPIDLSLAPIGTPGKNTSAAFLFDFRPQIQSLADSFCDDRNATLGLPDCIVMLFDLNATANVGNDTQLNYETPCIVASLFNASITADDCISVDSHFWLDTSGHLTSAGWSRATWNLSIPALAFDTVVFLGDDSVDGGNTFAFRAPRISSSQVAPRSAFRRWTNSGDFSDLLLSQLSIMYSKSIPINGTIANIASAYTESIVRYGRILSSSQQLFGQGISFAYGGATTSDANVGTFVYPRWAMGLTQELQDFQLLMSGSVVPGHSPVNITADGSPIFVANPDALWLVWVGANDYFRVNPSNFLTIGLRTFSFQSFALSLSTHPYPCILNETVSSTIANIRSALHRLYRFGARRFLVPNLPDLSRTPFLAGTANAPYLLSLINDHNNQLLSMLQQVQVTLPDFTYDIVDVFAFETVIASQPNLYGISVTDRVCYLNATSVCTCPSAYAYWDQVHPSRSSTTALLELWLTAIESKSATQLWTFGDSLSDPGNLWNGLYWEIYHEALQNGSNSTDAARFAQDNASPMSPPYFDGRFTNYYTLSERIAQRLGVTQYRGFQVRINESFALSPLVELPPYGDTDCLTSAARFNALILIRWILIIAICLLL